MTTTPKIIALSMVGMIAAATGFSAVSDYASASDPAVSAAAVDGDPINWESNAASADAAAVEPATGDPAEEQAATADAAAMANDFQALDADESGALSRDEFTRDGALPESIFAALDSNQDGLVSREEMAAYRFPAPAGEQPQP